MRDVVEPREVFVQGAKESKAITISTSGKMFQMLVSGIYSDKPLAVVREIWANAVDAHTAAGKKDVPFQCHAPTVFEPYFSVRDFGVGMDHERVMGLYSVLGASTKDKSNDETGQFGIGSKSPFAYGDAFTVKAFDGVSARVYSCYIGEAGSPNVDLMDESASSEETGIEVSIPVSLGDIEAFYTAIRTCLLALKVAPDFQGTFTPDALKTGVIGEGWSIVEDAQFTGMRACQGAASYPINIEAMGHLTAFQLGLLQSDVLVDFEIGTLKPAVSREGLAYNETTKANIFARLTQIEADLWKMYADEIDKADTRYEAINAHTAFLRELACPRLAPAFKKAAMYRSKPLSDEVDLCDFLGRYHAAYPADPSLRAQKIISRKIINATAGARNSKFEFQPDQAIIVDILRTVVFIDNERSAKSSFAKLKVLGGQYYGRDVLWVKTHRQGYPLKRLFVALGRPPAVVYSEDVVVPKGAIKTYKRSSIKAKKLTGGVFTDFDVVPDDYQGALYVDMLRNKITPHPDGVDKDPIPADCQKCLDILILGGYVPQGTQVFAVPRSARKILRANSTWRPLWDVVKETLDKHFNAGGFNRARAITALVNDPRKAPAGMDVYSLCKACAQADRLEDLVDSPLYPFVAEWRSILAENERTKFQVHLFRMLSFVGQTLAFTASVPHVDIFPPHLQAEHMERALEHYPMIKYVSERSAIFDEFTNLAIDYIKQVDDGILAVQSQLQDAA